MEFKLNETEIKTLNKMRENLKFLVEADKIDEYFTFTSCGIGTSCVVKMIAHKNGEQTIIEKDITDYNNY